MEYKSIDVGGEWNSYYVNLPIVYRPQQEQTVISAAQISQTIPPPKGDFLSGINLREGVA